MVINLNLTETEMNALKFVSKENERYEKIERLYGELIKTINELEKLDASLQYGYGGNWYNVKYFEDVNSRYSGTINSIRVNAPKDNFTI